MQINLQFFIYLGSPYQTNPKKCAADLAPCVGALGPVMAVGTKLVFEGVTSTHIIIPEAFLRCHFARTQTSIGRSCSNPQTGHVRQHDTSTSSGPGYTRRGGRHDAGRAPRPLAASPQRQPPPLHPLQDRCASSRAARRRQPDCPAHRRRRKVICGPCAIEEDDRYLARAGSALRRHTRPPPRASDGRRAGADPMALFLNEEADS